MAPACHSRSLEPEKAQTGDAALKRENADRCRAEHWRRMMRSAGQALAAAERSAGDGSCVLVGAQHVR